MGILFSAIALFGYWLSYRGWKHDDYAMEFNGFAICAFGLLLCLCFSLSQMMGVFS